MDLIISSTENYEIKKTKVEVKCEEMEFCLLCRGLSELCPVTNSQFAEQFNKFNFIEVQIGYKLPECVCNECLQKLDEIGAFINMCKESLEKQIKFEQNEKTNPDYYSRVKLEHNEWKPEEAFKTEIDIEDASRNISLAVVKTEHFESVTLMEPPELNLFPEDHLYHPLANEDVDTNRRKVKICPECNENVTRYIDHYKVSPQCRPKNITCSMCMLKFGSKKLLFSHQIVHHGNKVSVVPYVCHICSRTFKYKGSLQRHLRVHKNNKQFICDQCGNGYTRAAQLQEHKNIHLNLKPYLCNKCGRQFPIKQLLYKHELSHKKHPSDSAYPCEICNRSFSERGLKMHMYAHLEDKTYKCQECNVKFETGKLYRQHLKTHPKKIVACPYCSKRVAQYSLKQHLLTHTEDRPFACPECAKKFRTKAHLDYHLTALHNANRRVTHTCSYCKKCLASKGSLVEHERIHTGEKPFKCHLCDEAFIYSKGRKKHVARVHGESEQATSAILQ